MEETNKKSFLIILSLIFLLPLFFIPGGALDLSVAKTLLFVMATVIASLVFFFQIWRKGSVTLPKHKLLWAILLLPLIYFLSAILSTPSALSLLGYNLEVGTFGFILFGTSLLFLSMVVFSDTTRLLQALLAFIGSISLIALFVLIKIFFGAEALVLGNFLGNMGNPIGNWTDLAMVFSLLSILSALVLGMLPMKKSLRTATYFIFGLSLLLAVVINFSSAFAK